MSNDASHCAKCGAPLPPNWPKGLCSRCALQGALELSNAESQVLQPDSPQGPGRTMAESESDTVLDRTGAMIGRYKLLQKIGEGGFGVVYMAEQQEPVQRKVALKIIKAGMDTREVIARFEAERQAIALMDHPNIARVLDAGATDAGRPYFVMELVRGIPITDFCDQGHLPAADRLKLFMTVCHAVQHAHQKGVIHRDIKPSNVLVTLHDGKPVPKVIDFGVAKALGQKLTEKTLFTAFHHMIGTPAYMSPEQAALSGLDIDTRADIYSLGVLLYELLTGVTPFDAETLRKAALDEIRRMIRETEPLKPSTRLHTLGAKLIEVAKHRQTEPAILSRLVRGDLDWIVMKCLEKDRTRRYETANGLARDIERHLNNEAVVARPPSRLYRFQKLARRNKLAFGAAAVLGLALLAGLTGTMWQLRRAQAGELLARQHLYASEMNLALRVWEENNLGRALELLERQRPVGRFHDLRGWEWRYLWRLCRSDELFTLGTHSNCVTVIAMSPDGRQLASAGWDKTVRLWVLANRRELAAWPHEALVYGLAYSPDGQWIASSCIDQTVWLWNAPARRLANVLTNDSPVQSLIFSPDSQILAGADWKAIKLWEPSSGRLLWTNASPHQWMLPRGLAFSPDGKTLAYGDGNSHQIVLWDLHSNAAITNLSGHSENVFTVAFSPDGKTLVSGGYDRTVRVWDLSTFRQITNLTSFGAWVGCVAFSPRTNIMATACADQRVKFWDTRTWQEVATLKGHTNEVWFLAFSPDGTTLATCSKDGTIRVWSAEPREPERNAIDLPVPDLDGTIFSADATTLMHLTYSNQTDDITFCDTRAMKAVSHVSYAWTNYLNMGIPAMDTFACALSPAGRQLAVASDGGVITIWDRVGQRVEATLRGNTNAVRALRYSPQGTHLAVARATNTIGVWDLRTANLIASFPSRKALLMDIAMSADNRWLVAGYGDLMGEVWDVPRQRKWMDLPGHTSRVRVVAISPDSQFAATGSEDAKAKLWDLRTRAEVATLSGQLMAVNTLTFSPDGRRLAVSGADGRLILWDVSVRPPLEVAEFKASEHPVTRLLFTPEGDTLFSVGMREGLRAWRAAPWTEIAGKGK